jgi:hypothetical protein
MQEKRNKLLTGSLIVLLIVIVAMAFLTREKQTFSVPQNLYNDVDLNKVDQITLEGPSGTTRLHFEGYRWKVNDTIDADRGLVEVLFATLQQAAPKRAVAGSLQDSVEGQLRNHGVKVSLFAGSARLKSFYAGGNEQKTQAIFLPESGGEPHLITIPGYRVYVSGIFEMPPLAWREKLVFNFNWQNFSRLEARYKNPAGNFDILMKQNQVYIPGLAEADTAKLNTYLDQISLFTVEEYIQSNRITDSLAASPPMLDLEISDVANRRYQLSVFATPTQFYGRIDDRNWAILNEKRIIPLLRPKEFFIKR